MIIYCVENIMNGENFEIIGLKKWCYDNDHNYRSCKEAVRLGKSYKKHTISKCS